MTEQRLRVLEELKKENMDAKVTPPPSPPALPPHTHAITHYNRPNQHTL